MKKYVDRSGFVKNFLSPYLVAASFDFNGTHNSRVFSRLHTPGKSSTHEFPLEFLTIGLHEGVVAPDAGTSSSRDALSAGVLLQEREAEATQSGYFLAQALFADAGFVLAEGHVEVRWTPKTGQLGGLDLLWAFPTDRLTEPGSIDLSWGSVGQ